MKILLLYYYELQTRKETEARNRSSSRRNLDLLNQPLPKSSSLSNHSLFVQSNHLTLKKSKREERAIKISSDFKEERREREEERTNLRIPLKSERST